MLGETKPSLLIKNGQEGEELVQEEEGTVERETNKLGSVIVLIQG